MSCPQTDQKPVLSELVQLSVNNKNSPPGAVPFARPGQAEKRKHILPGNYSLQTPPVRLMFDAPPEASMRYHCVPEYYLLHSILFLRVEPVSLASLKGHVCCCLKCYKLKTPRLCRQVLSSRRKTGTRVADKGYIQSPLPGTAISVKPESAARRYTLPLPPV